MAHCEVCESVAVSKSVCLPIPEDLDQSRRIACDLVLLQGFLIECPTQCFEA